jgi:virginiamycin B lyase
MLHILALVTVLADTCAPRSSDFLSLLPDGVEKREFVLDCTGCHQFGELQARPNGVWRTEAQWTEAVARMLRYAGATTSFPVISAPRDPARTAAWLARHLRGPRPTGSCARPVPAGATITEYPFPQAGDLPHDVAVDDRGRVVVTGMFTHRMYVLDSGATTFSTIPIPVPNANPRAVEIDSAGNWWVVLGQPTKLARYTPSTMTWQTFDVGVYPHSVAVDARGRVWFNGHFTHAPERIGFVDAAQGSVTNLDVPSHPTLGAGPGGPIPYEIRVSPGRDGRIWGSELIGNRIFGYDPVTRAFAVHDLPDAASGPRRFDVDTNGSLWIPAYGTNALLRFDPASARFESFALPLRDAVPYVVRIDHGTGLLWIGTSAADVVMAFDPRTRRFTVYPLPSDGALVRHIAIDPRTRDVWLAYGASPGIPARIARLRVSR